MTTLYELTEQAKPLTELEDLDAQAIADTLEGMGYHDKVAACIAAHKNIMAEVKSFDDESKRLDALKKTKENRANHLKQYVLESMQALGVHESGTELHKAKLRKPSQVVLITNQELIPKEFKRISIEPDKRAIGDALKQGQAVAGAELGLGKPSITFQ